MSGRAYARPVIAAAAALFVAVGACDSRDADRTAADRARDTGYRGVTLPQPLEKVDFTLTDTDGEAYPFRERTDGKVALLFFGYTNCPDVCPIHMASLAAVLDRMAWEVRDRIEVVFVTTDPERDTPERIREWLDRFDRRFVGLRGDEVEVRRILESFDLPKPVREETGDPDDYRVGHASQVIAFSADHQARLIYPHGTRQIDWAHDLPRLVREHFPDLVPPSGRDALTDEG